MKNTTTLVKTTLVAGIVAFAMTATKADTPTFETIRFNAPVFSAEDPLGVSAIQTITGKVTTLETTVSEVKEAVTNTISTTTVDGKKKSQLTGDVVVIGNVKAGNTDVVMQSGTNSIVFAVDRDIEDVPPEDGSIKFDANAIKFPGVNTIWFGDSTLASILSNAGQGEVNTIVTVKTNGVALIPDSNRTINIVIPSAGEGNVIESIKTNGVAVAVDANKAVDITIPAPGDANVIESITTNGVALPINGKTIALPNYVLLEDLQDGINFDTMTVSNLTINGKKPSLEGHVHEDKLDATNGVAFGDLKVYPMPSGIVGQTHTIITHESITIGDNVEYKEDGITYNGETYEFSSDTNGIARLKDVSLVTNGIPESISTISTKQSTISAAALVAIEGINNAQDIATIKSTLTNFLQQFVIQPQQ